MLARELQGRVKGMCCCALRGVVMRAVPVDASKLVAEYMRALVLGTHHTTPHALTGAQRRRSGHRRWRTASTAGASSRCISSACWRSWLGMCIRRRSTHACTQLLDF